MKVVVRHTKGKHFSNIRSMIFMKMVSLLKLPFTVEFSLDAINVIKSVTDNDRYDWCKIVGRKSLIPSRHAGKWVGNSEQMWVYSVRNERLVIGRYERVNGQMVFPKPAEYQFIIPGVESRVLTGDIYKSIFPTTPYYCGDDSNDNGIGGVPPADFEYVVRVKWWRKK